MPQLSRMDVTVVMAWTVILPSESVVVMDSSLLRYWSLGSLLLDV